MALVDAFAAGPVWLVGLSAGAILALRTRRLAGGKLQGVVAFAASPALGGLEAAEVPTLYIHGDTDRVFPLPAFESELRAEATACLEIVPGWAFC